MNIMRSEIVTVGELVAGSGRPTRIGDSGTRVTQSHRIRDAEQIRPFISSTTLTREPSSE